MRISKNWLIDYYFYFYPLPHCSPSVKCRGIFLLCHAKQHIKCGSKYSYFFMVMHLGVLNHFFLFWYWFFIRGFGFSFFQFGFLVESSFFFYSKLLWLWLFSNEVNATVVSTSFSVVWLCQGDIVRWEWGFTVLENDQVEVFSIPTLFGEEFFFSNLWPLFNILFLKTVNKTKKYWNPQLKTKTDFRFPEFQNL